MSEVEIEGQLFLCQKLPARAQYHIGRRLAPVLKGLMPLFQMIAARANGGEVVPPDPYEIIAALTETLALLSDTDSDYVMDHCLAAVRFRSGDRWAPLIAPGGGMMLRVVEEDLSTHLRLVWEVLATNLTDFSLDRILGSQNGMATMQGFPSFSN
jgi:hypothetical protein